MDEVLCSKVTPLKSIDRSQVTHLTIFQSDRVKILSWSIGVPDLDSYQVNSLDKYNLKKNRKVFMFVFVLYKWSTREGPFWLRWLALVSPRMNHNSSSTTPRQNTFFVVRTGITFSLSVNLPKIILFRKCWFEIKGSYYRIWHPNFERVPTPVRSFLLTPCSMTSFTRLRYWYSSCLSIMTKNKKLPAFNR